MEYERTIREDGCERETNIPLFVDQAPALVLLFDAGLLLLPLFDGL